HSIPGTACLRARLSNGFPSRDREEAVHENVCKLVLAPACRLLKWISPMHMATSRVQIVPTGYALGAEIRRVGLSNISAEDFDAIDRAWLEHLVLLIRGQELSSPELIRFSRRLGDLDWAPVQETGRRFVEGHPEIYVVSNVIENGVPIGSLGAGEAVW